VFIGERGPLTEDGVRTVCEKYAMATGVPFTPHVLRHTFAHHFLDQNKNDLIALGQILGHSHVSTTAIYAKRSQDDLQQRVEELRYG
jgi:site-specific recombinase XerD